MVKKVEILEIVPYLPFQFIKSNFTPLQKTNKQTGEIQKKKRKARKRRSFTSQRGFTQSDIKCDRENIMLPYYPIFLMVPFEEHFSYPLFSGKKSRRFSYFVEVITRNH